MTQERVSSSQDDKKVKSVEYSYDGDVKKEYKKQLQEEQKGKVRVSYGVNTGYFELEGKTVGKVRKIFSEAYSIPKEAVAYVDGKALDDDHVLTSDIELNFQKETGVKGTKRWAEKSKESI